ncbi:MAG: hypothetical protein JMN27_18785 [gamma proteobacterium endosymbiont of Lamellibrachia anaximandri]|nr:hypothetical protein [gamma proteobacterium endosymbiont of Lamellibrachia anaximandri]MBL3535851.1 hypothetical protein [gamma proteobacterium endosymbiont of Lamellibrachia anaximandri]
MPDVTQNDLFGGVTTCTASKDPETSGLESIDDKAFKRFIEKHYALISKLDDVGLPKPGEQIRLVTKRTFNSIQFIEFIANRETIIDMKAAIYSINFNAAKILLELVNSEKIQSVEILMSNLRNKAHREKEEIM